MKNAEAAEAQRSQSLLICNFPEDQRPGYAPTRYREVVLTSWGRAFDVWNGPQAHQ